MSTDPLNIEAAIAAWLDDETRRRGWAAPTRGKYRAIALRFASVIGADRPVHAITASTITAFVTGAHTLDTRKRHRRVMRDLFGWLARTGHLTTDPTEKLPTDLSKRSQPPSGPSTGYRRSGYSRTSPR